MSTADNVNANIAGLTPYEPGKPEEELTRELGITDIVKLASNENPRGPSAAVRAAIGDAAGQLNRYPDGHGFELKTALAAHLQCSVESLSLGNGSNEIIDLVARVVLAPGLEGVIAEHSFVAHPLAVIAAGGTLVTVPAVDYAQDLSATLAAVTERTRLVFIANPNNPTGTWHTHAQIEAFLDELPARVWVILDQAYAEYVQEPGYPDALRLQAAYDNLIVTRSFSKIYGLAALRVGYGISSPRMADLINRVRPPFNVNRLAQVGAVAALADQRYVEESRALNDAGMAQLVSGLGALGLGYLPSVGNFLCVDLARDAQPVFDALLREGVITRPIAGYGMPRHLRLTVGLADENERLLTALDRVL